MSDQMQKIVTRLVLRHAMDVAGVPQSEADFRDMVAGRQIEDQDNQVRTVLRHLVIMNYLARCEATVAAEPLYKITASGLRQILKQVPHENLDPMVWG